MKKIMIIFGVFSLTMLMISTATAVQQTTSIIAKNKIDMIEKYFDEKPLIIEQILAIIAAIIAALVIGYFAIGSIAWMIVFIIRDIIGG